MHRVLFLICVAVLVLNSAAMTQQANSQLAFRTARDLAQHCDPSGSIPGTRPLNAGMADYWQAFCVNYIVGVADSVTASTRAKVCFPDSISGDELKEVVIRYFRTHADAVRFPNAANVVRKAIASSYRCDH